MYAHYPTSQDRLFTRARNTATRRRARPRPGQPRTVEHRAHPAVPEVPPKPRAPVPDRTRPGTPATTHLAPRPARLCLPPAHSRHLYLPPAHDHVRFATNAQPAGKQRRCRAPATRPPPPVNHPASPARPANPTCPIHPTRPACPIRPACPFALLPTSQFWVVWTRPGVAGRGPPRDCQAARPATGRESWWTGSHTPAWPAVHHNREPASGNSPQPHFAHHATPWCSRTPAPC
jgi:hypothetical protein